MQLGGWCELLLPFSCNSAEPHCVWRHLFVLLIMLLAACVVNVKSEVGSWILSQSSALIQTLKVKYKTRVVNTNPLQSCNSFHVALNIYHGDLPPMKRNKPSSWGSSSSLASRSRGQTSKWSLRWSNTNNNLRSQIKSTPWDKSNIVVFSTKSLVV